MLVDCDRTTIKGDVMRVEGGGGFILYVCVRKKDFFGDWV